MPCASITQRDRLTSRLEQHARKWIRDIPILKAAIVASHYFSLPNHRGGVFEPNARYYTSEGREITFKDVPLVKIAEAAEQQIKSNVPADLRTEIYHKVLTGMPEHQAIPEWDTKSPESIYASPLTPYSLPRDGAGIKSNQDLLDLLAPAGGISLSRARDIATQITWWDAMSEGVFGSMLSFKDGVRGGRLGSGHLHTMEDVPVNYFRDRLIDWVADCFEGSEAEKQALRRAICPDLSDKEITDYARLIAADKMEKESKAEQEDARERTREWTQEERARELLKADRGRAFKTPAQAMKAIMLQDAIDEVDETIDYQTPKLVGVRRKTTQQVEGSVVTPHWSGTCHETGLVPDEMVDRDCDQVRAMIKVFLSAWDWDSENFRSAFGPSITRDRLLSFMQKRGTDAAQLRSAAFLLSWEFFNRRQKLGLSIVNVDFRDDLKKLEKNARLAALSEAQQALVKKHEEEIKVLEDKHGKEHDEWDKGRRRESEALVTRHAEELKALWENRGEDFSERRDEMAKRQRKKEDEMVKERGEELRELQERQHEEMEALEKSHAKALKAAGEGRRGRSGKRPSNGLDGGKAKRSRG